MILNDFSYLNESHKTDYLLKILRYYWLESSENERKEKKNNLAKSRVKSLVPLILSRANQ